MIRFLKILAQMVALLLILYLIIMSLLFTFVRSKDIKPTLLTAFKKNTHLSLNVEGEIKLKLFPWPSINATGLTIDNPKNFNAPNHLNLAHINHVKVRLKIIDLLRKQIHPTSIFIDGIDINLITLMDGRNNWPQPEPAAPTSNTPTSASTTAPLPLSQPDQGEASAVVHKQPLHMKDMKELPLIQITEANIHIINLKTNRQTDIKNLAVRFPSTQKTEKYKMAVSCEIENNRPKINLLLHLLSKIDLNLPKSTINFEEVHMMTRWNQIVYKLQHPVSIILFGTFFLKDHNFNANLHGGFAESEGDILVQASKDNSALKGEIELRNISVMSAISLLTHKYLTEGTLNINASFTAKGKDLREWSHTLSGSGKLNISNGKIKGINLSKITSNAINYVINPSVPPVNIQENILTAFSQASADYTLKNGLLTFKNFLIDSKKMKIHGYGTIYFPDSSINMELITVYDSEPQWSVPISITGSFSSPIIKVNMPGMTNEFMKTQQKNQNP